MSDYLNPIPDCSHHNEVDGLCNHSKNFTPECHVACCPRLTKEISHALHPPKLDGTFPVVLYLGSEEDREELIQAVMEVRPSMKSRKL